LNGRIDRHLGAAFGLISIAFLASFRAGNRFDFEVPIALRAAYLVVAVAFLIHHGRRTRGTREFIRFCVAVAGLAYTAEVIGVQTGWLFGHYHYGDRLGPLMPGGVPAAIPVFWTLLIYAADDYVTLAFGDGVPRWLRAGAVGAVVAAWDLMIDPIAVAYDCWSWEAGSMPTVFGIPATNAPGWWLIGTLALLVAVPRRGSGRPRGAPWFDHLPALALVCAAANNALATAELGFPGAGVAGLMALAPYGVAACARKEWQRRAQPSAARAG